MLDVPTFRTMYPEFTDSAKYTTPACTLWLTVAVGLLTPAADRWGDFFDTGCALIVAHHCAIAARNQTAARAGAVPGEIAGPVTSKSVDKVSVARDSKAVSLTDDPFWNMSSYGVEFKMLCRLIGAGPIQL